MNIDVDENELRHFGTLHKSGRYPWGSGEDNHQRNKQFLDYVDSLKKKGMTEQEIAKGMGLETTTQLRAQKAIAKNEEAKEKQSTAMRLKDKGMSNVAIGEQMGLRESSVRALLNPAAQEKAGQLANIADLLKKQVDDKGLIDVGLGVETQMGISGTKLKLAVAMLKEQGYTVNYLNVPALGTNNKTKFQVLAPPGVKYADVLKNQANIKIISGYSEDNGRTMLGIEPPTNVDSKRVAVKYGPDGGKDKDGVIELRRGVDDLSMGSSRYAQVRIAVDGTHYIKGMAMYADDLPAGTDIRFNTNKTDTGNKLDALKSLKDDADNPFGAIIRQKHFTDANGKSHLSAINIVGAEDAEGNRFAGEEGSWSLWSKNLSTQFLSKQSPSLAKKQLDLTYKSKVDEYNEILQLTNPTVKKKLLKEFSDGVDSSAVQLKAASLPRQSTHVILPIPSMKENEVYAPKYNDGEKVVLVRYPHAGTFEIPELTVNNKNGEANRLIRNAADAVGIHPAVAQRLSGADFDGDTVLVIPNNARTVRTSDALSGLKDFDPQTEYKAFDGMVPMDSRTKQVQMGNVSNLITDMTIKGATHQEMARAVRHSMVVIDAEKHNLNWKQSAKDNGISDLKKKYQGTARSGASTLISKANSDIRVPDRTLRPAAQGGGIDPKTGKKIYVDKPDNEYTKEYTTSSGQTRTVTKVREIKSKKLAETDDAFTLASKNITPIETVYAQHSNKLKSLANEARKSYLQTPNLKYSPTAKKAYDPQVRSLQAKLNMALKNKPLERQAQLIGNATLSAKKQASPDMSKDEIKKIKSQSLKQARDLTGAQKQRIQITPDEWHAIQAGAITNNFLDNILQNTDTDLIKKYATPRATVLMTDTKVARAKAMLDSGYTQAQVSDALGVSTSTLATSLKG